VIGALLTQQTRWEKVEQSLQNLRRAGLIEVNALAKIDVPVLCELIRPSPHFSPPIEYRRMGEYFSHPWGNTPINGFKFRLNYILIVFIYTYILFYPPSFHSISTDQP
jgi:hypothetical protein